mgnify:CR=1 FL=1
MSQFTKDLDQEKILSGYLDKIYAEKNIVFKRINNSDAQHHGIDIIIHACSNQYNIDEKAQLHYLNADLPTFTFELSYLKNNVWKEGWLFNDKKQTHYYFLVTSIYLKDNKKELTHADEIDKIKITSVNRSKLISHLADIGLNKKKLQEYDKHLRERSAYGGFKVKELNSSSDGQLYFSEHLSEQPMNIQLRLKYLINNKVAKTFYDGK